MGVQTYRFPEIGEDKYHVWGRTIEERAPITLFWTGSGVEVNVCGAELWADLEADYTAHEPWIDVLVNGALVQRLMLVKGQNHVCLFRNMNPEMIKNVRIIKDTQAMLVDDPGHVLRICSLSTDGSFHPVAERKTKIEFIGDSITSGEGATGAKEEEDWISMFFSAVDNYAFMTAEGLQAEYRSTSQSGFGLYCGWDGDIRHTIPSVYEKICGVMDKTPGEPRGEALYDFNSWQPDYVVLNLGTNDHCAFDMPTFIVPETGEMNKLRRNIDGSMYAMDVAKVQRAGIDFLGMIRRHNPGAHIIWAFGMLGHEMAPALQEAVELYQQESGDTNVEFLLLEDTVGEAFGARKHPGHIAHQNAAKALIKRIRELEK